MGRTEAGGITDQTDVDIFYQYLGADQLDRTASRSAGPRTGWQANQAVRAAVDDTGRRMHDDGSVAVNDRLTLTRVGAARAHLHSQTNREPLDRDHPRAQALLDSSPMSEDDADTLVRLVDAKGQPFRAAQATLTKDDLVLLGLSA